MRFLIVKTSSLGDIIQAFPVVSFLKELYPTSTVDWVCEERNKDLLQAHPFVDHIHLIPDKKKSRQLKSFIKKLRKNRYDLLFDLQGNCKSALITFCSKADKKIGLGKKSVKEWPNLLVTTDRFEVDKRENIQHQYLSLATRYFNKKYSFSTSIKLNSNKEEPFLSSIREKKKLLVSFGSNWENKRLKRETLIRFLHLVEEKLSFAPILTWGSDAEKKEALDIKESLSHAHIIDRMPFPNLYQLMGQVDYLFAVDSSLLHLCGLTSTPTFTVFGPTEGKVFMPFGEKHGFFQGKCPYEVSFIKQCPYLRSCKTGACLKDISAKALFNAFAQWLDRL